MYFTSNEGSQNMFVYQTTLDTLKLKKEKGNDYVLSRKSKAMYTSKLKPLYTAFIHSIKISRYRKVTNFDKDPLAVKRNNYTSKIINVYIVYDLNVWPRNPTKNFKLKNWFFGITNTGKNNDKEKYLYSAD